MNEHDVVFLLEHVHDQGGGCEDIKTIGIYSTLDAAQRTIERLRIKPGFRDAPDGFNIDPYPLNTNSWEDGFLTVDAAHSPWKVE
jgi:hypothetical protein